MMLDPALAPDVRRQLEGERLVVRVEEQVEAVVDDRARRARSGVGMASPLRNTPSDRAKPVCQSLVGHLLCRRA